MNLRIRMLALLFPCFIGAGISLAEAVTIRPGDLIVADANRFIADAPRLITPGAVIKINPQTGDQEVISEGEYLITPIGIALLPDGGIIVADRDLPGIVRIEPFPPHTQTVISSGGLLRNPIGLAIDPTSGEMFVAVPAVGIVGVTPLGQQRLVSAAPPNGPAFFGIARAQDGSLIVTAPGRDAGNAVIRINPTTGEQTTVASGGLLDTGPLGIAVDRDGSLVVGGGFFGNPIVMRVHPATGAQTVISSGQAFVDPYWVAIEADGSIIVSDQEAFGPRDPISGTHQGAIFRVNPVTGAQTLVSAGNHLGDPNGVVVVPGIIPPPPPPVVPVVLVHGIGGDCAGFGEMKPLLEQRAGLPVSCFSYDSTRNRSITIEELAAEFGQFIVDLVGEQQQKVDVVAHSLGGLIARAWMAGLAEEPYAGQIRKLVLVGVPNYGAESAEFDEFAALFNLARSLVRQLQLASEFIQTLHGAWSILQEGPHRIPSNDILFIVGLEGQIIADFLPNFFSRECRGCNLVCSECDGVVEAASALLPDATGNMARYLPYRHADSGGILPLDAPSLVRVLDENHGTYRLVREFLLQGGILPQCCGDGTLNVPEPQFSRGLLFVRALEVSEQPVDRHVRLRLELPGGLVFRPAPPEVNREGGAVIWDIDTDSLGTNFVARVSALLYCPREVPVLIQPPVPTAIEVILTPRRLVRRCR